MLKNMLNDKNISADADGPHSAASCSIENIMLHTRAGR